MDKRFWAIIGVIVVVFGGILTFHSSGADKDNTSGSSIPTNHVLGKLDSKVTLLEYGDYQCPVCENYSAVVKQVQQKYNDTIKFQFRNLPLSQVHPNAFAAARTAEAADMQGKYWEMHEALYDPANWQDWTTASSTNKLFETYAKQLGMDVTKFKKDFASMAVNRKINADMDAYNKTKQQLATPTFFINGKYVANTKLVDSTTGQPSVEAFSQQIDEALRKAK
jgi:protein-disulfide isomerase